MNLPVSVIIPAHNRERFVATAVRSALEQNGITTEVIVVDDQSTDATLEILATFGNEIRVVETPDNVERGAARNLGVAHATGELIAFLDSDDAWEATKLVRQIDEFGGKTPSVTGIRFIDAQGTPTGKSYVPPPDAIKNLPTENQFLATPSTILLERTLFERVGGFPEDRNVQGSEDWLFLMQLAREARTIGIAQEPLVRYRLHGSNWTSDPDSVANCMWAATTYAMKKGLVDADSWRSMRAHTATTIARQYARDGNWKRATHWISQARAEGGIPYGLSGVAFSIASAIRGLPARRKHHH